jgi:hypothetical protein
MMPGVLVLVGARQGGTSCDIIVPRFCGLVLLGYLGFLLFLGFAGVFPLFHLFPLLVSFLYTSCMLKGAFTLFINFLLTYKKKVFSTCQYIHVCVCVCVHVHACKVIFALLLDYIVKYKIKEKNIVTCDLH